MKRILLVLMTAFFTLISFNVNSGVSSVVANKDPDLEAIEVKELDSRAKILSKYLASHNSPMQYHAQDFVDAADKYALDWKMLPAISGVESTFGKHIPGGYNAYGWGVYGTNRIYFASWTDGIFSVAKGLRENYLNRGLTNPYSINKIYAASPRWGGKVTYFMNDLEKFASQYDLSEKSLTRTVRMPYVAAVSGQLVLR